MIFNIEILPDSGFVGTDSFTFSEADTFAAKSLEFSEFIIHNGTASLDSMIKSDEDYFIAQEILKLHNATEINE